MGATAETRISKRRINELEARLKRLQRDLQQLKSEKKKVGNLRKQTPRAMQTEADCLDVLNYVEETYELDLPGQEDDEQQNEYRCRDPECIKAGGYYDTTGKCDTIEAGVRLIVVCRDCGSRYTVAK